MPLFEKMEEIGEYIRIKRLKLGFNQKEFADFIGLREGGERTVGGWERGEHKPTRTKTEQILNVADKIPFRASTRQGAFHFIDLFAGIGGIRLPFHELGGKCVFTSEWDKFAKKTYAANFGEYPKGDITAIPASEVKCHDLLLAGFPCQAFSQAGLKKGFSDTRGTMFFEIQRILAAHKPAAFLLENVKQLKGHDNGRTLQTILSILRGHEISEVPSDVPMSMDARKSLTTHLNYNVDFRVLRATNFGVPQNRERVYIIGFNKDKVPEACRSNLAEIILDDLASRSDKKPLGTILENNAEVDKKYTISDKLLAGHKRRLEEHRAKGNGFGYSVFDTSSLYCNTISARYYKDGSEILIDQSDIGRNPRKLTPRECARIQGFPEDFNVDVVSDVQSYRQFGNSVAVPVIRAIAEQIVPRIVASGEEAVEVVLAVG